MDVWLSGGSRMITSKKYTSSDWRMSKKMCVPFRCKEYECVFDVVVTDRPRKHRKMTWRGGVGMGFGTQIVRLCLYAIIILLYYFNYD